jgi:hypothetical protein
MKIRFDDSKEASAEDQRLCRSAEQVSVLLEKTKLDPSTRALMACLDDTLGAAYSLFYAIRNRFADRAAALGDAYYKDVLVRATDMSAGSVRTEGKWTAGYYMNSALLRIDAVYHRALATVAGNDGAKVEKLLEAVGEWFRSNKGHAWSTCALESVNKEVRSLKHRPGGITTKRDATLSDAVEAIRELLTLLEAFHKAGCKPLDYKPKKKPMQISIDPDTERHACQRANKLGISLNEYIRQIITRDLGPAPIFDLGPSRGSDVRENKDAMISRAFSRRRSSVPT